MLIREDWAVTGRDWTMPLFGRLLPVVVHPVAPYIEE